MQLNYTKDQLAEAYRKLPAAMKEAMEEIDTPTIVEGIGQKFGLHIDQMGELAAEMSLTLYGLVPAQSLVNNIQRRLFVTPEQAAQIAAAVNEQVFLKIREVMRQAEVKEKEETGEKALVTTKEPTPAPDNRSILEQKMGGVYSLEKPWTKDPYLEKP